MTEDSRKGEEPNILDRCRFVRGIEAIPALPANIFNLMAELHAPDISPRKLERLISCDPGLVMHVLQTVNSLFYALPDKVLNVQRATAVIGLENLRELLSAYAVRLMHENIRQSHLQQSLWQHAIAVAVLARLISEEKYHVVHAKAYVAGLLHDIGKVAMYLHRPRVYAHLHADTARNFGESVESEYRQFGFTHLEAGWMVLDKMGFPREMKEIAAFHHDPEYAPAGNELVWIVDLANRLSYQLTEKGPLSSCRLHMTRLGLREEQLDGICARARSDILRSQGL
jgi:putative nucleotidyltransferase with HDIG domain